MCGGGVGLGVGVFYQSMIQAIVSNQSIIFYNFQDIHVLQKPCFYSIFIESFIWIYLKMHGEL